jgi:hypothetical protein
MKRRRFIKTLSAGAAGFGILKYPRLAHAGWGDWPSDKIDAILPESRTAKNVLEVYMYGGVSAFDSFYSVPGWGTGNGTFLNAYLADTEDRFQSCGFGTSNELTEPFADDENGTTVHLGPWSIPLRDRPDITDRMRIITMRHDQLAHEGANPLALSGNRLGSPRLAGLGSSIQRYFLEQQGGLRATPYAYVLYPGVEFATDNVSAGSAVGLHPGNATPLSLTVSAGSQITQLLSRDGVGNNRAAFDSAMSHYENAYRQQFRAGGKGAPTRSQSRSNFEFSNYARRNADAIQSVLDPSFFQSISGSECGSNATDMPAMQLRLATALLTRTTDAARYVQVIDGGITPNPNAGHDTHDGHVNYASRNVVHTLKELADRINAPGENDPEKLNLDETMIVLTTEFGRTPERQGSTGLNHWPQGYVSVFIGGPVTSAERGVYGYITEDQGIAQNWMTPAENRMSVMAAMGIYPFSPETFAVGDVLGGVANELEAATRIREQYLGVTL